MNRQVVFRNEGPQGVTIAVALMTPLVGAFRIQVPTNQDRDVQEKLF